MSWWHIFIRFDGRIPRKTWWLASFVPVTYAIGVIAYIVAEMLAADRTEMVEGDATRMLVFLIPVWWVTAALSAKRLHDRGRTALWLLVPVASDGIQIAVFGMGALIGQADTGSLGEVLDVAALAFTIWLFVELGFLRGTQGPNRFGPDPLGATEADAEL